MSKAKSKAFKRIPKWRKESGPIASVMPDGPRVRVDFEYSPARVKAIKTVENARFHPEDKSWSIPIRSLDTFLAHKEFPATTLLNGILDPAVVPLDRAEALVELRKNPFAAPEAVVAGAGVESVVRLHTAKHRLRVVPRFGSITHRHLKRFRGAIFSAYDSSYSIPVDRLASLLKELRDERVIFAVDVEAGRALSQSSRLRSDILAAPERASAEDLMEALLVPFIVLGSEEDTLFRPCYFTSEQFKLAFPGAHRKGGDGPFVVDGRGLLALAGRMRTLPFPIWFTADVCAYMAKRREALLDEVQGATGPVDDVAADVIDVPLLWKVSPTGRGVLSINFALGRSVGELMAEAVGEALQREIETDGEGINVEIPDSRLVAVVKAVDQMCTVHGLPAVPKSAGFARRESEVKESVRAREATAYYATLSDVAIDGIDGLEAEAASRLFPHQRVAVSWLVHTPHAFLGDDMGLGKTLSVLSYYQAVRKRDGYELLLVVCPNSLTRNWVREVSMWYPSMRATVLAGDKGSKAWALRLLNSGSVEYEVLVVNYEAVRLEYVTPELETLASKRRTLLCLDESQRVKNPTSKTFKAIADLAPQCNRRVLLSGTPTPKDVSDLWAQMRILDGGKRFGKSFYKWLGSVADLGTEYSEFAVKKFNQEAVDESVLRVHEVMLRRRKEKVVNLPEKTFTVREIELTGAQRERYDEIREGLILRMRSVSGEQFVREITNILEEYLRAVQVASNPRLIDPEWKGTPAKFAELDEIVNEIVREQDQKIVIWTNYLGNIAELTERYKDLGAAPFSGEVSAQERERTVRAFQSEASPRVLVAVPAAGGVGITLTAAQTAVYIDKTWNAEHWMQSVDRIHRIGQKGTVNVISLLGCKVDEIIHWNLRKKERAQAEVLGDEKRSRKSDDGFPSRQELLDALEG